MLISWETTDQFHFFLPKKRNHDCDSKKNNGGKIARESRKKKQKQKKKNEKLRVHRDPHDYIQMINIFKLYTEVIIKHIFIGFIQNVVVFIKKSNKI